MAKKRKNKRMRKRLWFTPAERIGLGRLTALLAPGPDAERRVMEFFTAHIRNPHTRNPTSKNCARSTLTSTARSTPLSVGPQRAGRPSPTSPLPPFRCRHPRQNRLSRLSCH